MTHLPALIVTVQLLAKTAPREPMSEIRTAISKKALQIASQGVDAGLLTCPVSCDHIPRRSWALFRARDVMRGVIESFKAEQAA